MVPFKIQYIQAGAIAEDKFYISQKKLPQIHQQVLEDSIRHYLEELKQKPTQTPKTEGARIREKGAEKREHKRGKQTKKAGKAEAEAGGEEKFQGAIEKDEQGHVTHLDIKI